MTIEFTALASADVADLKMRGTDAYGLPIETGVSGGAGTPCRHCLNEVPEGEAHLILAHRPFSGLNPYTETGPIFLCAQDCDPWQPSADMPPILQSPQYIARGYTADERIRYGTGGVVKTSDIPDAARQILKNPDIAFVDIRSASNNCFLCRIRRTHTI